MTGIALPEPKMFSLRLRHGKYSIIIKDTKKARDGNRKLPLLLEETTKLYA